MLLNRIVGIALCSLALSGSIVMNAKCVRCGIRKANRYKKTFCSACVRHGGRSLIKRPRASTLFYSSDAWLSLRYETIKKYDRKCMVCFRTGIELHVDHIKPRSKFPKLELEASNLQVLCMDCNLGKGNRDEIDWR